MKKINGISYQDNPSVIGRASTAGITLVALVVTIVVLLILAGITITYVLGDNSVFKQASEAKLKADIASWQERLEMAKSPIFIEGLGIFDIDRYIEYIEEEGIINNKDTDVIDNGAGTYEVTTKPGYVFGVKLIPSKEEAIDAEIEYIGQVGKIPPVIRKIEVSATATSITGKAIVSRLGNGTVTYYYKLSTAGDDSYIEITNVNSEVGATQSSGITAGEKYTIKVVAKNEVGEATKTIEITATKIFVDNIILEDAEVKVGKTATLVPKILPENATNKNITWRSNDLDIATVDENGVITGKKEGTTTITATATDGSNKIAMCTVTVILPTVEDLTDFQTENIDTKDEFGNRITIPEGFKVLPSEATKVTEGIVIRDREGNEFVWIPIGDVKYNNNGDYKTIILGRYTFDFGSWSGHAYHGTGKEQLMQSAADYTQEVIIDSYYQELVSSSFGNAVALDLKGFLDNAIEKGGYYFARYEASIGQDDKAQSKVAMPKTNISQVDASIASQKMYKNCTDGLGLTVGVSSDLMNSYAWDTAIVFIQQFSGDTDYSRADGEEFEWSSHETGSCLDKRCNIYDMACNHKEYTTETCSYNSCGATKVGGFSYQSAGHYQCTRK